MAPQPKKRINIASSVVIAAGVVRVAIGLSLGFRPFDDSFITFRYAKNLAMGYGLVFNFGEPVLGTSAPLWALILGAIGWLGFDIPQSALVLSLFFDVLTAWLLRDSVSRISGQPILGTMAGLLFLGTADFLSISRSGMETSLFCLILAGSIACVMRNSTAAALLLAGLSCFARPEGVLVLGAITVVYLHRRVARERWRALRALALPLLLLTAWLAITWGYYGSPVPTSVAAKAEHVEADEGLRSFSWMNLRLFAYLGQFGEEVFTRTWIEMRLAWSALAILGTAVILLEHLRARTDQTSVALILLVALPAVHVGVLAAAGAFTWFPWYYGPLYFFLVPLVVLGVWTAVGLAVRNRSQRQCQGAVLIVGVLLLAQVLAALTVKLPGDREYWVEGYQEVLAGWAPPEGETVAALEVGTVGWELWPARVLDLVGLVSPGSIGRSPAEVVLSSRAKYLCVRTDDGAALLSALQSHSAAESPFRIMRAVTDPYRDRQFLLLERRLLPDR